MARVKQRRGLKANLPTTLMEVGELLIATDTSTLHHATSATVHTPIVPDVEGLETLAAVTGTEDLLMILDASEASATKAKKITFNNFKTALNIPTESTDEKVAVVSGGTAGYLWGTNGSDGVLRGSTSISLTKDSGNGFATLAVEVIDCGTF